MTVKVGTIIVCENSVKIKHNKPIALGVMCKIGLIGIPNTFSFNILTTLLYLERGKTYDLHIKLCNPDGKKIFEKTREEISIPDKYFETGDYSFETQSLKIQNQAFYSEGNYIVEASIIDSNDPNNTYIKKIDLPVFKLPEEHDSDDQGEEDL